MYSNDFMQVNVDIDETIIVLTSRITIIFAAYVTFLMVACILD